MRHRPAAKGCSVTTKLLLFAIVSFGLAGVSAPALAHHGIAGYDLQKTVTLTGTVTKYEWENPHIVVYMDAKDSSGSVQHWSIELAAPLLMNRLGWSKNSMKAGDQVVADVHPAKNGAPVGLGGTATILLRFVVNGTELPYLHK
jgi:hypothetical protein